MQGTTLSFRNIHNHGELFEKIMKARKPAQLPDDWDVTATGNQEFDQYDTPQSRWLAVHDDQGDVLASVRLTPTTAQSGIYSYLMKDAQQGLLDEVPTDLLFEPAPVASEIWEMTRVYVQRGLVQPKRDQVRKNIVRQLIKTTQTEDIRQLVALLPISWKRWAEASKFEMTAAGRVWNTRGRDYQAHWLTINP